MNTAAAAASGFGSTTTTSTTGATTGGQGPEVRKLSLTGINLSAAGFGTNGLPGVEGTHCINNIYYYYLDFS